MKVLIAEDEPDIWKAYKIALEGRDHETLIAEDGHECIKLYKQELLEQQKRRARDDYYGDKKKPNNDDHNYYDDKRQNRPPFDVVILDYRIPQKDGLQVAKEILELNPNQRIIFASAYVRETLEDSVKQLKRVVELLQKPFVPDALVDTIEDKEAQEGLKMLMTNLRKPEEQEISISSNDNSENNSYEPSLEQIRDLFEGLRKIQKGRTF
jgi:CheY-like chemotaxis protein